MEVALRQANMRREPEFLKEEDDGQAAPISRDPHSHNHAIIAPVQWHYSHDKGDGDMHVFVCGSQYCQAVRVQLCGHDMCSLNHLERGT